jgi:hypothetical protein
MDKSEKVSMDSSEIEQCHCFDTQSSQESHRVWKRASVIYFSCPLGASGGSSLGHYASH